MIRIHNHSETKMTDYLIQCVLLIIIVPYCYIILYSLWISVQYYNISEFELKATWPKSDIKQKQLRTPATRCLNKLQITLIILSNTVSPRLIFGMRIIMLQKTELNTSMTWKAVVYIKILYNLAANIDMQVNKWKPNESSRHISI